MHKFFAGFILIAAVFLLSFSTSIQEPEDEAKFEKYQELLPGTDVTFNMVPIPAGKFKMGSPEAEAMRKEDEGPQKEVELPSFWMLETEVTWDLYEMFIDADKRAAIEYADDDIRSRADAITRPSTPYLDPSFGMGKYGFPAISMTQYSALMFCKWLSETTGNFYRLPTEAEWEYACRAGTNTAYHFGDDAAELDKYGWFYENSEDKYREVATKEPNPWGLYDMHGNVAEWTLDQYQADYYTSIKDGIHNPWRKPTALHPRSVRGGSWDDDADKLRSAARTSSTPNWQKRDPQIPKSFWWNTDAPFVGFRIVRPAEPISQEDLDLFWMSVLDEG